MPELLKALQQIEEGEWVAAEDNDDASATYTFEGEHSDDQASWIVQFHYAYTLIRTLGWYEQTGEAASLEELIALARAMNAASKTLNDALNTWVKEVRDT